jgi:TPR repeat protein
LELASLYQQPEVQNYRRAFECAKMAAEHNLAEGELIFANLLFFGRGCESDINQAYAYYKQAYRHGIHYAATCMQRIEQLKDVT